MYLDGQWLYNLAINDVELCEDAWNPKYYPRTIYTHMVMGENTIPCLRIPSPGFGTATCNGMKKHHVQQLLAANVIKPSGNL